MRAGWRCLMAPRAAVPADGVYATWLIRRGAGRADRLRAAVSIGTNPTFSGRQRRVEAFVLDFDGDLYGKQLRLAFLERMRGEKRFESVEALVEQMRADIAEAQGIAERLLRFPAR